MPSGDSFLTIDASRRGRRPSVEAQVNDFVLLALSEDASGSYHNEYLLAGSDRKSEEDSVRAQSAPVRQRHSLFSHRSFEGSDVHYSDVPAGQPPRSLSLPVVRSDVQHDMRAHQRLAQRIVQGDVDFIPYRPSLEDQPNNVSHQQVSDSLHHFSHEAQGKLTCPRGNRKVNHTSSAGCRIVETAKGVVIYDNDKIEPALAPSARFQTIREATRLMLGKAMNDFHFNMDKYDEDAVKIGVSYVYQQFTDLFPDEPFVIRLTHGGVTTEYPYPNVRAGAQLNVLFNDFDTYISSHQAMDNHIRNEDVFTQYVSSASQMFQYARLAEKANQPSQDDPYGKLPFSSNVNEPVDRQSADSTVDTDDDYDTISLPSGNVSSASIQAMHDQYDKVPDEKNDDNSTEASQPFRLTVDDYEALHERVGNQDNQYVALPRHAGQPASDAQSTSDAVAASSRGVFRLPPPLVAVPDTRAYLKQLNGGSLCLGDDGSLSTGKRA